MLLTDIYRSLTQFKGKVSKKVIEDQLIKSVNLILKLKLTGKNISSEEIDKDLENMDNNIADLVQQVD